MAEDRLCGSVPCKFAVGAAGEGEMDRGAGEGDIERGLSGSTRAPLDRAVLIGVTSCLLCPG